MTLIALMVSLIVAAVMTAIFVWAFRTRRSWKGGLAFFVLVMLASWAGALWVRPEGAYLPPNIPWFPAIIVGFISALFLSWSVPVWGHRVQAEVPAQTERRAPPASMITPAYWVALFVLLVAIIIH